MRREGAEETKGGGGKGMREGTEIEVVGQLGNVEMEDEVRERTWGYEDNTEPGCIGFF